MPERPVDHNQREARRAIAALISPREATEMLLQTHLTASDVEQIIRTVSAEQYNGNLTIYSMAGSHAGVREVAGPNRKGQRKYRFGIKARDGRAWGARTSVHGAHYGAASWEAHRDVIAAIYRADPFAKLKAGRTTYKSREHFEASYGETARWNVGSQMFPTELRYLTVPMEGH